MVVTLAEPSGPAGTRHLMEKFVIDGGTPLSGIVVPAGNKNAALPILAASALTADEVVVRNVPRIRLVAGDVFMDEPSVMATENALMAAALTPGSTVIGNAACEPHVQDLARMLLKMGADIQGIGSNMITVHGAERLHGCAHDVAPDHIEIGSFMALAGVTGGELRIKDTVPADLRMIRLVFASIGLHSELDGNDA